MGSGRVDIDFPALSSPSERETHTEPDAYTHTEPPVGVWLGLAMLMSLFVCAPKARASSVR